jgi:hypothetical protein
MIRSDIDETFVARQLVNTVGMLSGNRRLWKIVTIDLLGFALIELLRRRPLGFARNGLWSKNGITGNYESHRE